MLIDGTNVKLAGSTIQPSPSEPAYPISRTACKIGPMTGEDTALLDESLSESTDLWTRVESQSLSHYLLIIIGLASVGGLLFGYDTGVISGVLVLVGDDLGAELSDLDKELVTSITSFGALFGSLFTGVYSNSWGRKPMIATACGVFVVDSLFLAVVWSKNTLLLGRFIIGLAVGSASTVVPVYIAELAPASKRGMLVTLNSVTTTGGQLIAYVVGASLAHINHGWRWMLGIAAIPPCIVLVLMKMVPESPRYSISSGDLLNAERSLRKIYPKADIHTIHQLVVVVHNESKNRERKQNIVLLKDLFLVPSNFRALVVACGLMASQQLCGFNSFMYYAATIFQTVGFNNPIAVSIVVSATNFLFTWVAVKYIDKWGRRKMLLSTVWIMVLSLVATGLLFDSRPSWVVISTITYVASYASALGNVPWQAIEFLPLEVRSLGSMFISATNWSMNFLVSLSFLSLLSTLGATGTFSFYAALTFLAYVGIYFCYPEVKGLSLENVNQVFEHGFLVKT